MAAIAGAARATAARMPGDKASARGLTGGVWNDSEFASDMVRDFSTFKVNRAGKMINAKTQRNKDAKKAMKSLLLPFFAAFALKKNSGLLLQLSYTSRRD